jgi:uncharacterized protein
VSSAVRSCLWRRVTGAGLERFELRQEDGRWVLRGTILAMHDHGPVEARYEVVCDAGWRTERTRVGVRDGAGERELELRAENGRWHVNGGELAAVQGCIDVDLEWSPSTNTLPIRRLGLPVGDGSGPLRMAWIRFPGLTIEALPQEYRHTSPGRYRYTSRGGTFQADIEVDEAGIVLRYADIWQRVDPSP